MNTFLKGLMVIVAALCVILLFVVTHSVISDAFDFNKETKAAEPKTQSRITIKEDNYPYYIIEVDSVEYLINNQGGIYPLIKK